MRMLAFALPVAALLFNCVLCFVTTRGVHLGKPVIEATELAIVGAALLASWPRAAALLPLPAALLGLNLAALMLLSGATDLKIAIDCTIPVAFALLGRSFADPRSARDLLMWSALLVLGFGLYEMFALPNFEHWFHVFDYYVDKGALSASHAHDTGTLLAENGVRPGDEGRQLFPGLLGLHRAGSVFLEPVSAGDFAAICVAWVCATRDWRPKGLAILAAGLMVGVLADARFSIVSAAAIAMLLATPLWRSRTLVGLLPAAAVAGLLVIGAVSVHDVDNSASGRLTGSGTLLLSWSLEDWLGLNGSRFVSMDTGYSDVFGNLGLLGAIAAWIAACMTVPRTGPAGRLFAAISVYFTLSLSISSSALSIKTAGLLWFALGALCGAEPLPIMAPRPAWLPQLRRGTPVPG